MADRFSRFDRDDLYGAGRPSSNARMPTSYESSRRSGARDADKYHGAIYGTDPLASRRDVASRLPPSPRVGGYDDVYSDRTPPGRSKYDDPLRISHCHHYDSKYDDPYAARRPSVANPGSALAVYDRPGSSRSHRDTYEPPGSSRSHLDTYERPGSSRGPSSSRHLDPYRGSSHAGRDDRHRLPTNRTPPANYSQDVARRRAGGRSARDTGGSGRLKLSINLDLKK